MIPTSLTEKGKNKTKQNETENSCSKWEKKKKKKKSSKQEKRYGLGSTTLGETQRKGAWMAYIILESKSEKAAADDSQYIFL